jgi:hypothetical protein
MGRVLTENSSVRFRSIDENDVRYYFTRSAWRNGVVARKWITELFRGGSGEPLDWRDAPIDRDGIYIRTEESVFRLARVTSLSEVERKVDSELVQPHESVMINRDWVHDYSSFHAEIGVLVNGSDGKPHSERIQVSTRFKKKVEEILFGTGGTDTLTPSPPLSPGVC